MYAYVHALNRNLSLHGGAVAQAEKTSGQGVGLDRDAQNFVVFSYS